MDNGGFCADNIVRFAPVPAIMPVGRNSTHYNMNHKHRGLALIFNHETFDREMQLDDRKGTNRDADTLAMALHKLDFDVQVHLNLKYVRLREVVFNAATFDHTNYDCFIMVVLTHGTDNNILSCYDQDYNFQDLWTPFSANMCTSLAGKPKVFVVQACRGDKYMPPVSLSITEVDGPLNNHITCYKMYKIPSKADFLFAFSSIPGYKSWRNSDHGSWFIQALCKELEINAYKYDILTLLTFVSRRVAIDCESKVPQLYAAHQRKQIPTIESRLTRLLQFNRKRENSGNAVEEITPWQQSLCEQCMKDIVKIFTNENTSIKANEMERVWNDLMKRLTSCGSGHCKEIWIKVFENLIRVMKWRTEMNQTPLVNDLPDVNCGVVAMAAASIQGSLNQCLEQEQPSFDEPPIDQLLENGDVILKHMNMKDLVITINNYIEVKQKEIDFQERKLKFKIQKMKLKYPNYNSESSEESE